MDFLELWEEMNDIAENITLTLGESGKNMPNTNMSFAMEMYGIM